MKRSLLGKGEGRGGLVYGFRLSELGYGIWDMEYGIVKRFIVVCSYL